MKKINIVALSSLLVFMSAATLADKPEWAGKGKPNLEELTSTSDLNKAQAQVEEREDELEELIKEKKKKAKKAKNKKDKKELERELEELEDEQEEVEELKEQIEDKKSGIEKQKEKKSNQVRNETGKGSETGQSKREENSKKWWKFWD